MDGGSNQAQIRLGAAPKYPNLVDPAPRNEPNQAHIHPRTAPEYPNLVDPTP